MRLARAHPGTLLGSGKVEELKDRFKAVRSILKVPENALLRAHPGAFPCPEWMKVCLFLRLPFCLFLLLEGAYAGKKSSDGHA